MRSGVCAAIIGVMIVVGCAPAVEPTPSFERAPSLAPSATVLPIIPEDDPNAFVGRSDPTSAALAAEGHPSQDPPLAVQPTEQFVPITVLGADGTQLSAQYFVASAPAPALLLLHDDDGATASLMTLGSSLRDNGFNVMVLSLRGYGSSSGQVDWSLAGNDARDAINSILTLPDVTGVAVIGTGRSAAAAMLACSQHTQCAAITLIDPLPDAASDPVENVAASIGTLPLLMLVSEGRAEAQQTAQIIQANSGDQSLLQAYSDQNIDQISSTTPLISWLRGVFP